MNLQIYQEVLVLFLMIGIGFYARKKEMINKQVNRGLVELLLNITLPLLIVVSFNFKIQPEVMRVALQIFVVSLLFHYGMFFLSAFFFPMFRPSARSVLRFGAVFSNCAFMGYPILLAVYGKIGVFYGSIFSAPFNIAIWTAGVLLFKNKYDLKSIGKAFLNPGVLAVGLGFFLSFFSITLPYPFLKSAELIGWMTTPLSMIVVGSMLGEIHYREILSGFAVYYVSVLRLVFIPLGLFLVLYAFGIRGVTLGVCVICASMPVAASTAAFSERYECEPTLASRSVFISTLLSIVTIPLIITLIESVGAGLIDP